MPGLGYDPQRESLHQDLILCVRISQMDARQLLALVLEHPEYISDYHLRGIHAAIMERHRQMSEEDDLVIP